MSQVPAHIAARQKRDLVGAAIGGLNAGSPPHISIAGNRFTLVDDAGNQKTMQTLFLDICVVDANPSVSKIFFDPLVPFEPGGDNNNPPICWSDNGVGASAQAAQPQNASCQLCPHNAWGSATSKATGKPTKACNDVKKIAVVVPGIDMVFLMRIPPASLKNWGKYCQTLGGHGVDLPDAITRVEFESQGVLKFAPQGYVDAASAAFTDKVLAVKGTEQLVGRNDRPWGGHGDAAKVAYAQSQANVAPAMLPPAAPAPVSAGPAAPAPTFMPPPPAPSAFGAPAPVVPFAQPAVQPAADPFTGVAETTKAPRKPRTPKAPAPAEAPGIPPFLQRNPEPAAPAPAAPQSTFGMEPSPAAPDAGIQAALDAAFRLPT